MKRRNWPSHLVALAAGLPGQEDVDAIAGEDEAGDADDLVHLHGDGAHAIVDQSDSVLRWPGPVIFGCRTGSFGSIALSTTRLPFPASTSATVL